jgi:hypothetical protein
LQVLSGAVTTFDDVANIAAESTLAYAAYVDENCPSVVEVGAGVELGPGRASCASVVEVGGAWELEWGC